MEYTNCDPQLYAEYLRMKMKVPTRILPSTFALMMTRTYKGVIKSALSEEVLNFCEDGMVFDALIGTCVRVSCQDGYVKEGRECVKVTLRPFVGKERNVRLDDCFLRLTNTITPTTSTIYEYQGQSVNLGTFDKQNVYHGDNSTIYIFRQTLYSNFSFAWVNQTNEGAVLQKIFYTLLSSPPVTSLFGFSPQHHI